MLRHEEAVAVYVDAVVQAKSDSGFVPLAAQDLVAIEGRPRLVTHFKRERDPRLVRAKKDAVIRENGELRCEACDFDTTSTYHGIVGDICEVHHRVPLGRSGGGVDVCLDDLAVLCPNCHRAIHAVDPPRTVEEFRSECIADR